MTLFAIDFERIVKFRDWSCETVLIVMFGALLGVSIAFAPRCTGVIVMSGVRLLI